MKFALLLVFATFLLVASRDSRFGRPSQFVNRYVGEKCGWLDWCRKGAMCGRDSQFTMEYRRDGKYYGVRTPKRCVKQVKVEYDSEHLGEPCSVSKECRFEYVCVSFREFGNYCLEIVAENVLKDADHWKAIRNHNWSLVDQSDEPESFWDYRTRGFKLKFED
ncbi:unnamed protein product [Caenorhabditis auriculariae]|uniref:Uncharacterized protein n=1 Tax=Caenorhabditis auriculariae TaxID=2777116 RepID=A0A8S1H5W2_9PELO|nr:unnamed protein product [Caenorhabditis auriculariae]